MYNVYIENIYANIRYISAPFLHSTEFKETKAIWNHFNFRIGVYFFLFIGKRITINAKCYRCL